MKMVERKRKRSDEDDRRHLNKSSQTSQSDQIKISHVSNENQLAPVIVMPFGVAAADMSLTPYVDTNSNEKWANRKMVLQSSQHPRMDYIANVDFGTGSDALMDHYLGVYDPKTKELKLCKVKQLALRTTLRPTAEELEKEMEQKEYQSRSVRRNVLGLEFGTKKAKKAIASMSENAVNQGIFDEEGKLNAQSKVLLTAVSKDIADMPTMEDMAAAAQAEKPRPKANLSAQTTEDVYPLETLIPRDAMDEIRVSDWMERALKEGLSVKSRYVARRVASVSQNKDVIKLQVLKYMLGCILFFRALRTGRKSRTLPSREKLAEAMKEAPNFMVDHIRKRFCKSSNSELTSWESDNLITHLAALSLFVDGYSTDPFDLVQDLNLEPTKMNAYFMEIGCKIGSMKQKDRDAMGLKITEAKSRKMARLELPLEFPRQKGARGNRRR